MEPYLITLCAVSWFAGSFAATLPVQRDEHHRCGCAHPEHHPRLTELNSTSHNKGSPLDVSVSLLPSLPLSAGLVKEKGEQQGALGSTSPDGQRIRSREAEEISVLTKTFQLPLESSTKSALPQDSLLRASKVSIIYLDRDEDKYGKKFMPKDENFTGPKYGSETQTLLVTPNSWDSASIPSNSSRSLSLKVDESVRKKQSALETSPRKAGWRPKKGGVAKFFSKMPELKFEKEEDPVCLRMQEYCQGSMPAGETRVYPSGTLLTANFENYGQRILDMEVRPDDIWVASFPKCGTTWTQEMVWLLGNNCDFENAKKKLLYERFTFLDFTALCGEGALELDTFEIAQNSPSPRFIKTHLPVELLPKQIWTVKPKIIYVSRNPKDAAISYFHHFRLFNNYTGTQEEFLEAYVQDKVVFSPFWEHVFGYRKLRDEPNVLINTFEEMKKDLLGVIRRTAKFLEVSVPPDVEDQLLDHLSFKSMKVNPSVNYEQEVVAMGKQGDGSFMRSGEAGGWKKELTEGMTEAFDRWTKEKEVAPERGGAVNGVQSQ